MTLYSESIATQALVKQAQEGLTKLSFNGRGLCVTTHQSERRLTMPNAKNSHEGSTQS